MLEAFYSASMVDVGMIVWSLLLQMIGQFATQITKPVLLFTQEGSNFSS